MHSVRTSRAVKVLVERGRIRVSHKKLRDWIEDDSETRDFESLIGLENQREKREDARKTLLFYIRGVFLQVCSFGVAYIGKRSDENWARNFCIIRNKRLIFFFVNKRTKAPADRHTYCNMYRDKKRRRERDENVRIERRKLPSERVFDCWSFHSIRRVSKVKTRKLCF